jgi:hypothetical protein
MCSMIDFVFDEKRICCLLIFSWLSIVLTIFYEIGILQSHFMHTGPSDATVLMGIQINTWYRYGLVALFTLINTCFNDFMGDAISPWIINTITDHKNKYIPYPKWQCIIITQFWSMYCNIMGVFNLFLSFTQVDFVILRTCADMGMGCYTNIKFLRNKTYNPIKYKEYEHHTPDATQETELQSFVIEAN